MSIRLNKITRDLNVGITTVVEFLQKKGFTVEPNPNTKISDEQYALLVKEFSNDKDLKLKTERMMQERLQNKAGARQAEEEKTAAKTNDTVSLLSDESRPKFKPLGKIDLNRPGHFITEPVKEEPRAEKPQEEAPQAEETPAPQPQEEVAIEEPAPVVTDEPEPVVTEETAEQKEPQPAAEPQPEHESTTAERMEEVSEGVFRLRPSEPATRINVIGQIDLAALNQSTRPRKKSKEEKKREREEKEKQRQDQRKQMKEAIMKEIRRDDAKLNAADADSPSRKKRTRIGKEKVDINNAQAYQPVGQDRQHEAQKGQSKRSKERAKKAAAAAIRQEVNEEDVARQVKETLARLTAKGKNKGAKYRKEKREQAADRMQEQENMELADSRTLKLTEFVTANELASMMDVPVTQVIATCMSVGIMVSINQRLDA